MGETTGGRENILKKKMGDDKSYQEWDGEGGKKE